MSTDHQERLARLLYDEGCWCGCCDYEGWDSCSDCGKCCMTIAAAILNSDVIWEIKADVAERALLAGKREGWASAMAHASAQLQATIFDPNPYQEDPND